MHTPLLKLAPGLSLGPEVVTRKLAFVGISGSGKTFGAGKLVEQMCDTGAGQVVIVDVMGTWWGLRLDADGRGDGLPIYVFGGLHGDLPLEPTGGALVADVIVDTNGSMVLDISDMTGAEQRRFVTDFATQLLRRKKRARSPIHIVWEECQDLCPEYAPGDVARVVGAVSKLAKQGRNFGVGSTFITQRPQAVSKEVLNQVECLFAFSTAGTQELKALKDWTRQKSVPPDALDELKELQPGECFVWSPAWLKRFDRVKFNKKRTYDTSATPTFGGHEPERRPVPMDLKAISTAMAATIERAKENDPAALRAELAKVRAEVARLARGQAAVASPPVVEVQRLFTKEDELALRGYEDAALKMRGGLDRVVEGLETLRMDMTPALNAATQAAARVHTLARMTPMAAPTKRVGNGAMGHPPRPKPVQAQAQSADRLPKGEVAVLSALIQYPHGLSTSQLAVLVGLASRTITNMLIKLRARGYATSDNGHHEATHDGKGALPSVAPLPRGRELQDFWLARLPTGEQSVLRTIIDAYPGALPHADIAQATGHAERTVTNILIKLRGRELAETTRGETRASETLFA